MTKKVLTTPVSDADIESLKIGDVFYLSGALITSRDMVHFRHVEEGMDLPYDLAGKAIFHAGPIMVPDDKSRSGFRVVSIGPTTSMRMEKYEREFLRKTGVKIVVGKGGMELGSREPIFDIVVSAAKKSTFSRLSQNETAKECYQLGFFKPENADAALAALEMMDFEGIEKVRQRVRQNGTLAQQLARMQQQMAQMAAVIAQQGTGPDEPARSAGGASAQKDGQAVKLAGLGNALPVAAAARAMDIH